MRFDRVAICNLQDYRTSFSNHKLESGFIHSLLEGPLTSGYGVPDSLGLLVRGAETDEPRPLAMN